MMRPVVDFSQPLVFETGGSNPDSMFYRPGEHLFFFELVGFRPPMRGEFYLSGAVVQAYRAPNDLSTAFWIVKPTHRAVQETRYVRGEAL